MSNSDKNQNEKKQEQPKKQENKPEVPRRPEPNVTQAQKSADVIKENRSGSDNNG